MNPIIERIEHQIKISPVLLYMKGTPQEPYCGFSSQVVHILLNKKVDFNYVNILENPDIRATLPGFAQWPTFPQLWVHGELIGGCDIICEMSENGELDLLLKDANLLYNETYTNVA